MDTNSHILKDDQKMFGWMWPEVGVASLVMGLYNWLYLENELMEQTDFLHGDANSGKQKVIPMVFFVDLVKNGCGDFVHETLKSAE